MRVKLAISALLALLVATTICSSVRADVLPTPQSLLSGLKETVLEADDWLFRGVTVTNTRQLKNALARKIDATIGLYDVTEHEEAADKLADDIRPKLTDPHNDIGTPSKRARSWLELYSEDSNERVAVSAFAAECQGIIEQIMMLGPPGRGIVEIEPILWTPELELRTISLIFKSYRPYTIMVYEIGYERYHEGELTGFGWIDSSTCGIGYCWETDTVPPYQEVTIYWAVWTADVYVPSGLHEVRVVFVTSEGPFLASGIWLVSN